MTQHRPEYDLLVIGGGCNGTGIARDAALRGLRVALVEKGDLGQGATGNSSGMIHGGVRYLLGDPAVTRQSCLDSGYIQRVAPHLLFRIPFLVPVEKNRSFARPYLELAETYFSAYDRYQPLKNGLPHIRLSAEAVHRALPGLGTEMVGAVGFDEWGIDTYRLTAANALSAQEAGARILLRHRVISLLQTEAGQVYGVQVADPSGFRLQLRASVVVNAAGAWGGQIVALAGQALRLRPGKGVHLIFGRRITNHAVVMSGIDGRDIFLMPHGQSTWIGTTDDDHFGDPDDIAVNSDDVEYLLGGVARLLPGIRDVPMLRTMVGLRPTLYEWGPTEDDLSRGHAIVDHGLLGAPGLVSVLGGKLASYRLISEEAVDRVAALLGRTLPCRSHVLPLPGAEEPISSVELEALGRVHGLPRIALQQLGQRQGCRMGQILRASPGCSEIVCSCCMVTRAEIQWVIRKEWVTDLVTLRRRTGLGWGGCGGTRCVRRAAVVLGMELGLSPARVRSLIEQDEALRFSHTRPVAHGRAGSRIALSRQRSLAGRSCRVPMRFASRAAGEPGGREGEGT